MDALRYGGQRPWVAEHAHDLPHGLQGKGGQRVHHHVVRQLQEAGQAAALSIPAALFHVAGPEHVCADVDAELLR